MRFPSVLHSLFVEEKRQPYFRYVCKQPKCKAEIRLPKNEKKETFTLRVFKTEHCHTEPQSEAADPEDKMSFNDVLKFLSSAELEEVEAHYSHPNGSGMHTFHFLKDPFKNDLILLVNVIEFLKRIKEANKERFPSHMDPDSIDATQIRNKLGARNKIHVDECTAEKLMEWCAARDYRFWKKEAIGKYAMGILWVSEAQIRNYIQCGKCVIYDTTHNTNRYEWCFIYSHTYLIMPF